MSTICASVNPRLLAKANRLFTGSLAGRVIEILQNARRAGATRVQITNRDGLVHVHDNGHGIQSFEMLLNLGGSGWGPTCEAGEDPAGVGLFCLAPRAMRIRSGGVCLRLTKESWAGSPVRLESDPRLVRGTLLSFPDEPWIHELVEPHAIFSGMRVIVDGKTCDQQPFITQEAVEVPELGCRIQVLPSQALPRSHQHPSDRYEGGNVLMNFHGQVIRFYDRAVQETHLYHLVEFTGAPTQLRLMLPARTRIVENEAYQQLRQVIERESYRYLQRQGRHRLPFRQYLRARELGILLPEAEPTYRMGLLFGESPEPVQIDRPLTFPLEQCYQLEDIDERITQDAANMHLLGALGEFEAPFVPVSIDGSYDGYSWARTTVVESVELTVGDEIHSDSVWGGVLTCVSSLVITVHCSDGRSFSSPVPMAVRPPESDRTWEDEVLVTRGFWDKLTYRELWFHLGGWYEDGDTYETQESQFEDQVRQFWLCVDGPDEQLRSQLMQTLDPLSGWKQAVVTAEGVVHIQFDDGTARALEPVRDSRKGDSPCSVKAAAVASPGVDAA